MAVHPDVITVSGIFISAGAGICFYFMEYRWPLIGAIVLILLRLCTNLLDGMIARKRNMASPWGECLAETADRCSDAVIIAGAALSPLTRLSLGLCALAFALFTAYMELLGRAIIGEKVSCGIMGKIDRLAVLIVAALVFLFRPLGIIFDIAFGIMILGSAVTIIQRGARIKKMLKQ
jgi:phosphatidylglycerophosphate synthase